MFSLSPPAHSFFIGPPAINNKVTVNGVNIHGAQGQMGGLEPGKNFCMDPDELTLAAEVDPDVGTSLQRLQGMLQGDGSSSWHIGENQLKFTSALGVETGDAAALKYKKFASMCKDMMTNAALGNLRYFGSPIMVNSVCLGSFCLMDYDKELEFGEGTPNFAVMQRLAVRAGRALELHFQACRDSADQQALHEHSGQIKEEMMAAANSGDFITAGRLQATLREIAGHP